MPNSQFLKMCINRRASKVILLLSLGTNLIYRSAQACILENEELNCTQFAYNDRVIQQINASLYMFERATFFGSRILIIPQSMLIGFENVTIMEFSASKIHFIEPGAFDTMTRIEELRLHGNSLTEVGSGTFNSLTTLKRLDLSYNCLTVIKQYYFSNLVSLDELWLNNNELKYLEPYAFQELFKLRSLFLFNNYLVELHSDCFKDLTYLNILCLSNNNLTDINTEVFDSLRRLTQLDINDNNLSIMRMRWFHSLIDLRRLEISNNALTEFNGQELLSSLPTLSEIKLNDNMWSCSSLSENLKVLSNKNVSIVDNSTENGVFGITCQNSTLAEIRGVDDASSKTAVGLIVIVVLLVVVVVLAWLLITVYCKLKRSTALNYRSANFDDAEGPYSYVGPPR